MIVPDHGITFSREDASNLAQAKAANACGQWIVLRHLGVDPADIERLYLAGGFATYVDVAERDRDRLPRRRSARTGSKVGNASVRGRAASCCSRVAHASSSTSWCDGSSTSSSRPTPDFFELFVEGCQFKPIGGPS